MMATTYLRSNMSIIFYLEAIVREREAGARSHRIASQREAEAEESERGTARRSRRQVDERDNFFPQRKHRLHRSSIKLKFKRHKDKEELKNQKERN